MQPFLCPLGCLQTFQEKLLPRCGSEPLVPVLLAGAPLWEGTSTVARNTSEVRCSPVIMGWTFCPWVCEVLGRQC